MVDMLMIKVKRDDYDERESAKRSMTVADLIDYLKAECEPNERIVFDYSTMYSPLTRDMIRHRSKIRREDEKC